MTSTPTPVDDNRLNMNDESMYKAIDKVMGNSEQTYEEFLKSFTHLKKTDTEKMQKPTMTENLSTQQNKETDSTVEIMSEPVEESKELPDLRLRGEEENELQEEVLEPGQVCGWMSKAGNQAGSVQFDNFTYEQNDDEGSDIDDVGPGYIPSTSAALADAESHQEIQKQSNIEPNINEDPRETDEKTESQAYIENHSDNVEPNIKEERSETDEKTESQANADANRDTDDDDDALEEFPSGQESIDAMKNILLENFLSDFCEEMGLGGMGFDGMTDMGFDDDEGDADADTVTFDDDPLELLLNITDNGPSTKEYVNDSISNTSASTPVSKKKKKSRSKKRKKGKSAESTSQDKGIEEVDKTLDINGAESKDERKGGIVEDSKSETLSNKSSVSESRTANSGALTNENSAPNMTELTESKVSVGDSCRIKLQPEERLEADFESSNIPNNEEVNRVLNNEINENDQTELGEETFGGKMLFPGEADDDQHTDSVATETRLEFKATYRELPKDATVSQECSNDVEDFVLDEDFDYDNVILTPKYSAEDMERLSALMAGKVTL